MNLMKFPEILRYLVCVSNDKNCFDKKSHLLTATIEKTFCMKLLRIDVLENEKLGTKSSDL